MASIGQHATTTAQIIPLDPGLYLFRHASRGATAACATLHPAPIGSGHVDIFPAEGVERQLLAKLGDCLVVRVSGGRAGVLLTRFHPATAPAPDMASDTQPNIQIDRVDQSGKFIRAAPMPSADSTDFGEPIELLGHVEGQGDVVVKAHQWLGDPQGRKRIEGFAIRWPGRSPAADLVYTCHVHGHGQTPPATSGQYAGTRQKAAPILSLSMLLVGAEAERFALQGQVVFAGQSPLDLVAGQKMSGAFGTEPLVAMRLALIRKDAKAATTPPASPWDDPAITQIFRATG